MKKLTMIDRANKYADMVRRYYQHNGTSYVHVSDYAALEARLAEADERVTAATYLIARFMDESDPMVRVKAREFLKVADSASAVQPERCCVDYPRCDCNSPPEPDNAPTLQPCGHPWKAQHNFKCILCSSPG